MKREQFINYLLNPDELKGESAAALTGLIKEFPYFQSAQLLYLKTLHNEKSIHYQSQLKIAAAYSANRKSLYFLINGEPKKREHKPESTETAIPVINENEVLKTLEIQAENKEVLTIQPSAQATDAKLPLVAEVEIDKILEPIVPPVNDQILKPIIQSEVLNTLQEESDILPLARDVNVKPSVENSTEPLPIVDKQLDSLNANIFAEAINSSLTNELEELAPLETESKTIKPTIEIPEPKTYSTTKPESVAAEFHSFVEWLKISQGQKIEGIREVNAQPKASTATVDKQDAAPKMNEKRVLIEKFITTEPRIVPKKQEFYNPVNKARQSVMENDFIVSETLAKVYLKQGNFQRALKSYEILSLKFPEKSTYFAAQILKIKELQQEKK